MVCLGLLCLNSFSVPSAARSNAPRGLGTTGRHGPDTRQSLPLRQETLEQQDSSPLAKERVMMNKPSNKNTLREETQPQARPTSPAIKNITIARQRALHIPGTPKRLSGTAANGWRPKAPPGSKMVGTKPTITKSDTNAERTPTGTRPAAVLLRTKSARGNLMPPFRHGENMAIFA